MKEKLNPELMRGSLELMVLSILTAGPNFGYSLQQTLHESTDGLVDLKAGTMYPLLHRLEDDKLIRHKWDDSTGRRRKWYELTAKGRRRVEKQAKQWLAYADCIRRIVATVVDPGPV